MLIDTGVLVAAADDSDRRRLDCQRILERPAEKIVTDAILSEAHHLIASKSGWARAGTFLESLDRDLIVECSVRSDRERARELCREYLDARLDYTDALTVAVAERLGEGTIATLDRRHFTIVRPRHTDAFDLLP